MRISCQSVKDCVSQCRIVDVFIPFVDRKLRGHNNAFLTIPVFQQLQEREAYFLPEVLKAKVIQDDQGLSFQVVEEFNVRAIQFG